MSTNAADPREQIRYLLNNGSTFTVERATEVYDAALAAAKKEGMREALDQVESLAHRDTCSPPCLTFVSPEWLAARVIILREEET